MARAVAARKAGVALVLWRVARWRGCLLTGDPTVSHSLASGSASLHPQVSALLSRHAPRAAPLIVTAFGDAIAPRRSQVWMADLIALCALVGISDTLVRTAVSRLVAAGRLEGVKDGRRSAYGLTPAARAEFDAAEVLIYGPVPAFDWCLVPLADEGQANALEARGFARLRGGMLIGPGPAGDDVLAFAMTPVQGHGQLPDLAAQAWPLAHWAQGYEGFIATHTGLLGVTDALDPASAVAARLLIVDAWRAVRLNDVGLPPSALPHGWPRDRAQGLFLDLYQALQTRSEPWLDESLGGPGDRRQPDGRRSALCAASRASIFR